MANIWLDILKPKGIYAKWLIIGALTLIVIMSAQGHFEILRQYLDTKELTFSIGKFSISAYGILRALITVILLFWAAAIITEFAERRVGKMRKMRAANRTLLQKLLYIAIYFIAFLMALHVIGIDLTTLTVFGGALGIGLGFGLQKIASNFMSGLILLFEKSIEEDDLVELADGTFGFIRKSRARYTLIETPDGREILVPNEDLIISRVTNWTYSSKKGRIEIIVGVSYDADIERAQKLMIEAAKEHPSCIEDPPVMCFLRNFGESSVDFTLHFWIDDVTLGRWTPQSEVMFTIWKKFKKNNIEIPFPQRDLHIKSSDLNEAKKPAAKKAVKKSAKKTKAKK